MAVSKGSEVPNAIIYDMLIRPLVARSSLPPLAHHSIPLDMIPMNDRSNMRKLRETVSFNEKITRRKIIGMGELKMDTRRIRKTIDRKEGKVERKGKTNKVAPVSDPPV